MRSTIRTLYKLVAWGAALWFMASLASPTGQATWQSRVESAVTYVENVLGVELLDTQTAADAPQAPYALLHETDGSPARWNPCGGDIRWVWNPQGAPAGAEQALQNSFGQLAAATGLPFVAGGPVDRTEVEGREVLVMWVSQTERPELFEAPAEAIGAALPWVEDGNEIVSARVAIDTDWSVSVDAWHNTVLHELGHAVGLDHVANLNSVMQVWGNDHLAYTADDLAGLAAVGASNGCLP